MHGNWLRGVVLGCGLTLPAMMAVAQAPPQQPSYPPPPRAQQRPMPAENPIERWNRMSPEERERALARLPPARAAQIRQRIERYNQLPPQVREALNERYERLSQLPPQKQALVRERLRELRQLPQERRPEVRRAIRRMSLLPEPERRARMANPAFQSHFSPQEQQIIRDISGNFPDFAAGQR
jgi:Protein of unknown function (DUF3106)